MNTPLMNVNNPMRLNGGELPELPKRKEAYTTYLYMGFAVLVVVLTVVGFLWW